MSGPVNAAAALKALGLQSDAQTTQEINLSGVMPKDIATSSIIAEQWVTGLKPSEFMDQYSSQTFDYEDLKSKFKVRCKDFGDQLTDNTPSRALEFSAKVLFEFGPMMRVEKKGNGDKAIRLCFAYNTMDTATKISKLTVHVVIITTFKDMARPSLICDNKLILTMKQATLLAMETFNMMCIKAYNDKTEILMTPLCGAVFGKDCVKKIAAALGKPESDVICMLNSSTAPNGHYLTNSNISCAIVAMIASTKGVSNKNIRKQMITKVIKQYCANGFKYDSNEFNVITEHALGRVPPGLDSGTLIENFQNIQLSARVRRSAATKTASTTVSAPSGSGASKSKTG